MFRYVRLLDIILLIVDSVIFASHAGALPAGGSGQGYPGCKDNVIGDRKCLFILSDEKVKRAEAASQCEDNEGYLVTIDSEDTKQQVNNMMEYVQWQAVWIGARLQQNNSFPADDKKNPECGIIWYIPGADEWMLGTQRCTDQADIICITEKDNKGVCPPDYSDCGYSDTKRCVGHGTNFYMGTWYQASQECSTSALYLPPIDNQQQLHDYQDFMDCFRGTLATGKIWTASSQIMLAWDSGYSPGYRNWKWDQPNPPIDSCIRHKKYQGWEDRRCTEKGHFICEYYFEESTTTGLTTELTTYKQQTTSGGTIEGSTTSLLHNPEDSTAGGASPDDGQFSTGAIAAVAGGSVFGLVLICVIVIIMSRRRKTPDTEKTKSGIANNPTYDKDVITGGKSASNPSMYQELGLPDRYNVDNTYTGLNPPTRGSLPYLPQEDALYAPSGGVYEEISGEHKAEEKNKPTQASEKEKKEFQITNKTNGTNGVYEDTYLEILNDEGKHLDVNVRSEYDNAKVKNDRQDYESTIVENELNHNNLNA